jgi:RHS repeat-associated protein
MSTTLRVDETGYINLGACLYDSVAGRFISADPLGHAASSDLYSFCGGDPVNHFDADGRLGRGFYQGLQLGSVGSDPSASFAAGYGLGAGTIFSSFFDQGSSQSSQPSSWQPEHIWDIYNQNNTDPVLAAINQQANQQMDQRMGQMIQGQASAEWQLTLNGLMLAPTVLAPNPATVGVLFAAGYDQANPVNLPPGTQIGVVPMIVPSGSGVSTDYRATFFEAYPELEGEVVVHHAVEQQTLTEFPGVMTEEEIHSLENLRGIPKALNSEVHLSQIRLEWNRFYEPFRASGTAPTRAQLLQKAAEIDADYGSQFTPPTGDTP